MTCEKPTEPIIFTIEFITPLLIGGAKELRNNGTWAEICDPLSLGKALRGGWRFWFRAVCGGMLQGTDEQRITALHILENKVFGSTSNATFKLRVLPLSTDKKKYPRCPHKTGIGAANRDGCMEGSTFDVTIIPRKGMLSESDDALKALMASVWLWGNLGSAGNRARRGFGSPFLIPEDTDHFYSLPMEKSSLFPDKDSLIIHLGTGFLKAKELIESFVGTTVSAETDATVPRPSDEKFDFFVLKELDQIWISNTVNKVLISDNEFKGKLGNPIGLLNQIHGSSGNREIGFSDNHARYSSPVYVRLHKIQNAFLPVATWSRQVGIIENTPSLAVDYLQNHLGCL